MAPTPSKATHFAVGAGAGSADGAGSDGGPSPSAAAYEDLFVSFSFFLSFVFHVFLFVLFAAAYKDQARDRAWHLKLKRRSLISKAPGYVSPSRGRVSHLLPLAASRTWRAASTRRRLRVTCALATFGA